MHSVLACITTRDGNPPRAVQEKVEAACRYVCDTKRAAAFFVIQQDQYGVACCRNQAVSDLLSEPRLTHLFFCDDDVHIPRETLAVLLDMTCDVAAGCYPSIKTEQPGDLKAETYIVVKNNGQWLKGWFRGKRKVDAVGAGCLLIHRSVFDVIGFPWFRWPEWYQQGQHLRQSDDLDFCNRCREAGLEIWCNGDLRCGHVKSVDIANFVSEAA